MSSGNQVFRMALIISVVVHAAIFMQNPNFPFSPAAIKNKQMEVSYLKNEAKKETLSEQRIAKVEPLKPIQKITLDKIAPPQFNNGPGSINKNKEMMKHDPVFIKPNFVKPEISAMKKKITMPVIENEKINNPTYMNYYQLVREKIRHCAYQNYGRSETGDVYLSFVISSSGELRDARLIEEKSSPSIYLTEIALRSIENAAPFPEFPKELDYPQLSFNVIISFEIE